MAKGNIMGIWSIIGIVIMLTHSFFDKQHSMTIGSIVLDILAGGLFGPLCIIIFSDVVLRR